MHYVLQLIEKGNAASLLFLIAVMCYVGNLMAATDLKIRKWGLRLAAGALVAYATYGVVQVGEPDADALSGVLFRGLLAAGLMLGLSWIVLPAIAFFYRHFQTTAESARWKAEQRQEERNRKKRDRETEARRQQERDEWERLAPERERAAREAEVQRRREEEERQRRKELAARTQHQREDARFSCQLLYDRLTPEQQEHFSMERFHAYFETYLTDSLTPEQIAKRAEQLQTMIGDCFDPLGDKSKQFSNIKEIAEAFQQKRDEIESIDYDPKMKESLVMLINKEERTAIRRFLSP